MGQRLAQNPTIPLLVATDDKRSISLKISVWTVMRYP